MTDYKKADKQVVDVIKSQIDLIIKNNVGALAGHDATISTASIVEMACEMYENKEQIRKEAGLS
jgi:hypothetical protein